MKTIETDCLACENTFKTSQDDPNEYCDNCITIANQTKPSIVKTCLENRKQRLQKEGWQPVKTN